MTVKDIAQHIGCSPHTFVFYGEDWHKPSAT